MIGEVWNKFKKAPKKTWIIGSFLGAIKKTLALIFSPSKETAVEFLKAWARILVTPQKQIHDIVVEMINTQMSLAYWFMNILFLVGFSILTYFFIIAIKKTIKGTLQWVRKEAPKVFREGPLWVWTLIAYWGIYLISYSLLWSWPNWPSIPAPNLLIGIFNWVTFPFQGWKLMIFALPILVKPFYDVMPKNWIKSIQNWFSYTRHLGINESIREGINKSIKIINKSGG